jgi:hypothetical protein
MKEQDEKSDARYPAIYTNKEAKRWSFMNCTRDHTWHAEKCEQSPPQSTGAALTASGDQAHRSIMQINHGPINSWRRWTDAPMTP